jgi:hypothetical protein
MTAHQTAKIIQKYTDPSVGAAQRLPTHATVSGRGQRNPGAARNHNIPVEKVRARVGHHANMGPTAIHV